MRIDQSPIKTQSLHLVRNIACTHARTHIHTHTHTIQSYLPQYYVCVQLPALYCIMFVYTAKDYKCQSVLDLGIQQNKKKVKVSPFLFSILSFVKLKVKDRLLLVLPKKSIFTSAKSSIKKTCGIKDRKAVSPSCLGNR